MRLNYQATEMSLIGSDTPLLRHRLKASFYQAVFKIMKSITQAALNRFGQHIYNKHLPEYFRRLTNGQLYSFDLDYP